MAPLALAASISHHSDWLTVSVWAGGTQDDRVKLVCAWAALLPNAVTAVTAVTAATAATAATAGMASDPKLRKRERVIGVLSGATAAQGVLLP
jgi:hypothetical protein